MLRENVFNLFVNPAKIAGKLGSTEIGATEPLTKVTNALQEMGPVSYTHLDVYKRQVIMIVEDVD